jgi:hypothetical protein
MNAPLEQFKQCFKCQLTLPLVCFYKHFAMKDGYLNKCKTCTKSDVFLHREQNLDKIRAYDRARGKLEHRKQDMTKRVRIKRILFPLQNLAHQKVQRAVQTGALIRQNCVICDATKSVAHHDDYEKPLDVIWLCQIHHVERHKRIKVERK